MKIHILILFSLLAFLFYSCRLNSYNAVIKTNKKIKLWKKDIAEKTFIYENSVSITFVKVKDVVNILKTELRTKKLCLEKKENLEEYIQLLEETQGNFYVIEPDFKTLELQKRESINKTIHKKYSVAQLPDDNRSKEFHVQDIIVNGFTPQYKDSLNTNRLLSFYSWTIPELIIKEKARVFNKEIQEYQNFIILENFNFMGHGGETLKFMNDKNFMYGKGYSDIVISDDFYNCVRIHYKDFLRKKETIHN